MNPESTLLKPAKKSEDEKRRERKEKIDIHAGGSVREYIPKWDPDVAC